MKTYCTPLTVDTVRAAEARRMERRWTEVPFDERGLTSLGLPLPSTTVAP